MTRDRGVILVNVLVTLAIAATLVVLMVTSQDTLLSRNARAAAGVRAEALVNGAETSVVVALQRDMTTAPQTDHFGEPWAQAAQQEVALATGTFSIEIDDGQSRFNLNNLATGVIGQPQIFERLIRDIGLPNSVFVTVVTHMTQRGMIHDLADVEGLSQDTLEVLSPYVIALPVPTHINLNTADVVVIGAALGNPAAARRLGQLRDRTGFLTRQNLANVGVLATGGAGFTSQFFDVTSEADVDGVTVRLRSRIFRETGVGVSNAIVISRIFGTPR